MSLNNMSEEQSSETDYTSKRFLVAPAEDNQNLFASPNSRPERFLLQIPTIPNEIDSGIQTTVTHTSTCGTIEFSKAVLYISSVLAVGTFCLANCCCRRCCC